VFYKRTLNEIIAQSLSMDKPASRQNDSYFESDTLATDDSAQQELV
jgi:hypothetical protein